MDFDMLRFTKEHEWVSFDNSSDLVTIGITDFAAGELGDIVFVELPKVGREVKSTEPVGTVEAVKTVRQRGGPRSPPQGKIRTRAAKQIRKEPGVYQGFLMAR